MFYGNKRFSKYKKLRLKVQLLYKAVQLIYGFNSSNNIYVIK